MAAFPCGAPIDDEPRREVEMRPIQKKRQGAIFLLKADRVDESFVEHIEFGKIGRPGYMSAEKADVERRLELLSVELARNRDPAPLGKLQREATLDHIGTMW